MSEGNRLGEYLRARREQVRPADVGLPETGLRRVAGLRREEVALLAGISADYYLRLEQGRDRNPSVQVLESLARVLQLDATARQYLLDLGSGQPRRRRPPRREVVPTATALLLETIGLPAYVEGRYLDVLASNALARALNPSQRMGENRLRSIFLDPAERELVPDLPTVLPRMVAGFRVRVGPDVDDPRVVQLVGELSLASEEFRQAWARHDVKPVASRSVRMVHPQVGELSLHLSKLHVEGTDGQTLVVHHAEPGTADAERLALLGALTEPALSDPAPSEPAPSDPAPSDPARLGTRRARRD